MKRYCIAILCFCVMFGCATIPKHPSLRKAKLSQLIPIRDFLYQEDAGVFYKISPDGKKLAWIGRQGGAFVGIFVKSVDETDTVEIYTACWCSVTWLAWARDSRHILFKLALNGERHLYLADMQNPDAEPVDLTPSAGSRALFNRNLEVDNTHILLSQNDRCKACYDLYNVDIETGRGKLVAKSEGDVTQWISDGRGNVRGRIRVVGDRHALELRDVSRNEWEIITSWGCNEDLEVLGFTPGDSGIWILSNLGRDRNALIRLDIKTKEETVIFEDKDVDITTVFIGPRSKIPKTVLTYPGYPRVAVLDDEIKEDISRFYTKKTLGVELISMNDMENIWTVKTFDDKGADYYVYYRDTHEKRLIGSNRIRTEDMKLSNVKPIRIKSRDGMMLQGYVTYPRSSVKTHLPMVLFVHGGPWSRDYWSYDPYVQFLANRGYVVLQINFRGSSGYGSKFQKTAAGEFSGAMQTDLVDAVKWAIDKEIADPSKVAIVGMSYGGYAALMGLTRTPDFYACGVSINGISDMELLLASMAEDILPYEKPAISLWHKYVGNPDQDGSKKRFKELSPLHLAENINSPVLIMYGDRDSTADPIHSRKMIEKLQKLNKSVELLSFMNEGHSVQWLRNAEALFRSLEDFLAHHLGGRSSS